MSTQYVQMVVLFPVYLKFLGQLQTFLLPVIIRGITVEMALWLLFIANLDIFTTEKVK